MNDKNHCESGTISNSPYADGFGLPDELRIRAIELAKQIGTKAAAERLNVGVSSIYRWRKDYEDRA